MIKINQNIQGLKPSATLAINQKVKLLRKKGETIYHFGFGQSPFPVHSSIIKALKDNADKSGYLPTLGLEVLRKQIEVFLKEYQNIETHWENIYIGPGSKELLYQTILILEGTFLIPKGSWVSYLPQIKSKNGKYAILETFLENNFKLTPNVLESYCKENLKEQKTLILNSPNNPTGAVYSSEELEALAKVCRKYELIVMSDEIYSQVNFEEDYSASIATYYPEKTIVFGGLSKVFSAGGYRLGFMFLPKELQELHSVYRSIFSETFSAVASPIQYAAIEAFSMKQELQEYIRDCSEVLNSISSYVYSELGSVNIECTKPQGAFYLMIGFNNFKNQINSLGIVTNESLANHLLENYKVALLPASDFYFNEKEMFFRLAFVDFDGANLIMNKSLSSQIILDNHFENLYLGIKQLKKFVQDLRPL